MDGGGGLSADRPFPGLRPYEYAESGYFFGREEQTYALYRLLGLSQFVAVVGSSGSGKSSIVRAGLLPLLARDNDESERDPEPDRDGRGWRWIEFRPGGAPLDRLGERLAELTAPADVDPAAEDAADRAARRERIDYALRRSSFGLGEALVGAETLAGRALLIVVDQFEELFRYAGSGAERERSQEEAAQFVQLLLEATSGRTADIHVLITLRSDFIGDCARFFGLPEAVSGCQFLVPSLTRDQHEDAIRSPLERAGATIEPALVERLLNDIGGDLDELPVLQHCLQQLWEAALRRGGTDQPPHLTGADYEAVGGMRQALSRHADRVMAGLPGDAVAIEQVFRALSELDGEGRATRRALSFGRLLAETGIDEMALRRVLDHFRADDCSFLVPSLSAEPVPGGDTHIDVGHEALLRRWDRIGGNPEAAVADDTGQGGWLRREVHDGNIYRFLLALLEGGRTLPLDQVEMRWSWWSERPRTAAWAERYGGRIDRVRRLFDDSRAAFAADRRRRWLYRGAVAGALVVAVVLAVLSFTQWRAYKSEAEAAQNNLKLYKAEQATNKKNLEATTNTISRLTYDIVEKYRFDASPQMLEMVVEQLRRIQGTFAEMGEETPRLRYDQGVGWAQSSALLLRLKAQPAALSAAQRARDIFTELAAKNPKNNDVQHELANSWGLIGNVMAAQGKLDDAVADYRRALETEQRTARDASAAPELRRNVELKMNILGNTLADQKKPKEALAVYLQALALAKEIGAKDPNNTQWQRDLELRDDRVAFVLNQQGDVDAAVQIYRDSLAIARALARKEPKDLDRQHDLEVSDRTLGRLLRGKGRLDEALDLAREELRVAKALALVHLGEATWWQEVQSGDDDVATILKMQKHFADALLYYQDSLTVAQALASLDPTNQDRQVDLWISEARVGDVLAAQNHPDAAAALAHYAQALSIARGLAAKNSAKLGSVAYILGQRADAWLLTGNPAAALKDEEDRLSIRRQLFAGHQSDPTAKTEMADALGSVAWELLLQSRPGEALDRVEEALRIEADADLQINHAHALLLLGRFDEAKAIYLPLKDKRLDDGRTFAAVVREDYSTFRRFGIDTPDMKRIEALYN